MTGLHAHTTGAIGLSHMGWPLDMRWQTTVDDFNAAGYQTILSGINHERHPRTDRYEIDLSRDWADWKIPRAVDNAITALHSRDQTRPFYLNLATQEPHACTWEDVGDRIPAMPADWPSWMPEGMPRTPSLEAAFRRFAAAVVLLDRECGRLLGELDRLNLSENTLVVFTTDHGMSGPRGKGSLYALGTEIALLMRWPQRLPSGQLRRAPISNLGFRATLAEACGLEPVSEWHGRSFWRYASEGSLAPNPTIFLERNYHGEKPWRTESDYIDCYDPQRAVRTTDFLYIRNLLPGAKPPEPHPDLIPEGPQDWSCWPSSWPLSHECRPEEEMYDLARDPLELRNVAKDPHYSRTLAELREHLARWQQETGDFPLHNPPRRPEPPGWGADWPARSDQS